MLKKDKIKNAETRKEIPNEIISFNLETYIKKKETF